MKFEGSAFLWLTLALLPIALPVLVALILRQVLRIQGGLLALLVLCILGLGTAFGIMAFLDSQGAEAKGEVLLKREYLVYHLDGSWNRKMVAEVSYNPSETASPFNKTLDLTPARYDEINQGDFVQVRYPDQPAVFRIVRLEDQQVFSQVWFWLSNEPFLVCFVLGLLGVLAFAFMRGATLPTLFFLSGFVTVGSWWLATAGIPGWSHTTTLFGSLNSANAIIREVHPPYLGSGFQGWLATTLYEAPDLILMDITPIGHSEPILSVDEVDLGSSTLRPGQSVSVEYSAANPRTSLIPDASRNFVWKNGLVNTLLALIALLIIGALSLFIRIRQKQAATVPKPPGRQGNYIPL
jgi:hypothetical protein